MKFKESDLLPFFGYVDLGMYTEANDELENLPTEVKVHPIVLLARLDLLIAQDKWEEGVIWGRSLCSKWPKEHEFWFRTAFCLHELKLTLEAKNTLLSAPPDLHKKALFFYNLACYETQLGNKVTAQGLLKKCFEKDKSYRAQSLDDPDLEPLWEALSSL